MVPNKNLLPMCPTCKCNSMIITEKYQDYTIMACIYCDLWNEEDVVVYKNHCWNCGSGIDSRFSKPSRLPGMGYICSSCGHDLTEWKVKKGLVTVTELI